MNIKTIAQRLVLITLLLCNNTSMPAQNELPILGIIAAIFGLGAIGIHEYSSYCQKNNEVQLLNNVQDFIASITNNHKVEFQLIAQEGQNISEQGLEHLAKIVNKFNSKEHSSSHAEQYYKNIASYKDQLKQHKHALISNIAQWSRQNNKDALITNARSYLQELSMLEKQLTDLQLVVYEHLNFFNSLKLNAMIAEKYKNEIELYYEHKKASHSDFSKKLTEAILVDAHQSNITFPFISMRDTINQDLPAIKKTVHRLKAHPSLNKYHHMLEVSQKLEFYLEALSYIHDHIAKSQKLDDENFKKITIEQQKIAIQTNKDLAKAQKEQAKAIKEQTEELKRKDNIANQQLIEDRRKNDYNAEVASQGKIFEPERQNLKRTINQLETERQNHLRTIHQLRAEIAQLQERLKQASKHDECINELTTLQKKLNQIEVNIIQHGQNKTGKSLINAIHGEFTAIKNSTQTNEPKVNEKNETDDAAECPICLEHIAQNDDYFKTTCKHVFHKHCLREYKIKAGSNFCCPLCRGAITNLN